MPAKATQPPDTLNHPSGYSDMDWAAQLDPVYAAARAEVRRLSVGEEGSLSVKVKELVVLGVLASRGLQYGAAVHMRRAIASGATKEEWFEAINAVAVPGGGVAYSVGVRALQALEQEGAFPPPSPPPPSRSQRGTATPQPSAPLPSPRRPPRHTGGLATPRRLLPPVLSLSRTVSRPRPR
jgi:alkylhydroperoxidase/carboxymuconolactone decarboxylase family protein YurZ